jgi:hypothetical protein
VVAFAVLSMDSFALLLSSLALWGAARALAPLDGTSATEAIGGGAIAGAAFAAATLCSFVAFAGALSFAVLLAAFGLRHDESRMHVPRRVLVALAAAAGGFVAVYAALALYGYHPIDAYRACAARFAVSDNALRPRWPALLGNPVAFLAALGLPLGALHARSTFHACTIRSRPGNTDRRTAALLLASALPPLCCTLAGRPRGEVEHIFLPFVPLVVLATAAAATRRYGRGARWLLAWALPLLAAQAILVEVYFDTFW